MRTDQTQERNWKRNHLRNEVKGKDKTVSEITKSRREKRHDWNYSKTKQNKKKKDRGQISQEKECETGNEFSKGSGIKWYRRRSRSTFV